MKQIIAVLEGIRVSQCRLEESQQQFAEEFRIIVEEVRAMFDQLVNLIEKLS